MESTHPEGPVSTRCGDTLRNDHHVSLLVLSCWLCAALPCAASCPAQYVFGAGAPFVLSDWTTVPFMRGAGGTVTVTAVPPNTPATFSGARVDITLNPGSPNSPSTVAVLVLKNDSTIVPLACGGGFVGIDYYEADGVTTEQQNTGPALMQVDLLSLPPRKRYYVLPYLIGTDRIGLVGLGAGAFAEIGGAGAFLDLTSHPDVSGLGGPITFGFWRGLESRGSPPSNCMYPPCPPDNSPIVRSETVGAWDLRPTWFSVPTSAGAPNGATAADPVSTSTGEFVWEETDFTLGGPLPLSFGRYYASSLKAAGFAGTLGGNWTHNFEARLVSGGGTAVVKLHRGKKVVFSNSAGAWKLDGKEKLPYQLASLPDGVRFLNPAERLIYTFSPSNGALLKIEDRNGNALTVTPSSTAAGPDSVTDGLGRALTFTYAGGKLSKVQDQSGRAVSFTYSHSYLGDDLVAATDVKGNTTRYSYGPPGGALSLMTNVARPAGDTIANTYDPAGRVSRQTGGNGYSTTLGYGSATVITDALGGVARHTYQGGNLVSAVDPAGQALTLAYDSNDRIVSFTDRSGARTTSTYDPASGYRASYTDALGNTTRYGYTPRQQGPFTFYVLTQLTYADGTTYKLTYDASGNVTGTTSQTGNTSKFTYNARGQMLTSTDASGGVSAYSYNADGTLAGITPPAGGATTFAYDAAKRVSKIVNPDQTSRSFRYDARDRVIQQTGEDGAIQAATYDPDSRLTALTHPDGKSISATYDANGSPVTVTLPTGKTAGLRFDGLSRVQRITLPTGDPVDFGFDPLSRLTTVRGCNGKGMSFTYNRDGIVSSVADGLNRTWTLSSDEMGRITGIASPLAGAFAYTHDKLGRLASSPTAVYARDAAGRITGVSAPGGIAVSAVRDATGLVTALTDPNGNTWSRAYDKAGRLATSTDPLFRSTSLSYDSMGRVSALTPPEGTAAYTYDPAGNLVRKLFSDGLDQRFTYDASKRLLTAGGVSLAYDAAGSVVASNGLLIARDDSSRIAAVTYAPGKTVTYTYDCNGLLAAVADWMGGVTQLAYDDARELVSIARPNGITTQYAYDAGGRLTSVTESNAGGVLSSIVATLDGNGQVLSADRNVPRLPNPAPGLTAFAYDAANQVTGGSYDKMGRPLALGVRSYAWDLASRLTSYDGADGSASFTYDDRGARISRTSGGATQTYAVNYAFKTPGVSTVRTPDGDLRYYVHIPNGPLLYSMEAADNSRRFFHFDEAGSTLFLSDDSGTITDTYGIAPRGEQVDHDGSSDNPFTFQGARGVMQEGSTGLFYMGARYYDSATARFLSPDSQLTLDPAGANPYLTAPNPVADPEFARFVFSLAESSATQRPSFLPPMLVRLLEFLRTGAPRREVIP